MANLEDDRTVLELACLTEDRTRGEHAAMRRVAKRINRQWNTQVSTNKPSRFHNPIDLVALVDETAKPT